MTIQIDLNADQLRNLQKNIAMANNAATLVDKIYYIGFCYGYTEFTNYTIDYDGDNNIIAVKKDDIIKRYINNTAEAKQC